MPDFAVTITLNPQYAKLACHECQYEETRNIIDSLCDIFNEGIWASELTQKMTIHYHLFLRTSATINNKKLESLITLFLVEELPGKFGFIHIRRCKNEDIWKAYMMKNVYSKPDNSAYLF